MERGGRGTLPDCHAHVTILLDSRTACLRRHIDVVLVRRGLYLYYFSKGQHYVTGNYDWRELVEKAARMLTDRAVDVDYMDGAGLTMLDLRAVGVDSIEQLGLTWIEVAVLLFPGMTLEESNFIVEDTLNYHAEVGLKMATHLKLVADNIARGTWLSAEVLSLDATKAQLAAHAFHTHLISLRDEECTPYENSFRCDLILMEQLAEFKDRTEPCLLHQSRGRYKELFIFLSNRFLANPDSVLHCEREHAAWQWLEQFKRGIKFKLVNSFL